jgi:hypothetical protein
MGLRHHWQPIVAHTITGQRLDAAYCREQEFDCRAQACAPETDAALALRWIELANKWAMLVQWEESVERVMLSWDADGSRRQ